MTDGNERHPSRADLEAFDQGRLEAAAWSALERHLTDCGDCARTLAGLPEAGLAGLLREYDAGPGPASDDLPAGLAAHPHYRLLGVLGAGGMGTVYRAEHRLMGRAVALKVIHPHLLDRPDVLERFRQEVRAAARLAHPNIVTAYDAGEADGASFLIMEYVEGETIDRVLARRGALPVAEACDCARQAALGLQHAHAQGLVHRDLKPGNLLRTPQGQVKILDFGLARLRPELRTAEALTPAGAVLGTPTYLAPEQARDPGAADARADLYSLGCTLYHLLAGRPPFHAGTALQLLLAHQDQTPPPLSAYRDDVPAELARLVERLLAKEPAQRCQTAAQVVEALAPFAGVSVGECPPSVAKGNVVTSAPAAPQRRLPLPALATAGLLLAAAGGLSVWWVAAEKASPLGEVPPHARIPPEEKVAPPKADPLRRKDGEPWSSRPTAQAQALAWLKAEEHFGPNHPFLGDMARMMDQKLAGGRAFLLRIGPGVGYAGKPTLLAGRHHDLYALEFAQPQGRKWVGAGGADLRVASAQSQEFAPLQHVRLSAPEVAAAEALDAHGRLVGSVLYQKQGRFSGAVALRLTCMVLGATRTVYRIYGEGLVAEEGRLAFDLTSLIGEDEPAPREPAVLFFELGLWRGQEHKTRLVVLSNTVAVPVLFQEARAGPQPDGEKSPRFEE